MGKYEHENRDNTPAEEYEECRSDAGPTPTKEKSFLSKIRLAPKAKYKRFSSVDAEKLINGRSGGREAKERFTCTTV